MWNIFVLKAKGTSCPLLAMCLAKSGGGGQTTLRSPPPEILGGGLVPPVIYATARQCWMLLLSRKVLILEDLILGPQVLALVYFVHKVLENCQGLNRILQTTCYVACDQVKSINSVTATMQTTGVTVKNGLLIDISIGITDLLILVHKKRCSIAT